MAELICIGNAMVDVFAEVSGDFCRQFALHSPVQHINSQTAAAIYNALSCNKIISSSNTACPPENSSAVIISSGGAQKQHTRDRVCLSAECNTACPPENSSAVIISSGGGAANTAKIASGLGVSTVFIGAAGDDSFGILFEEELARSGVSLHLSRKRSPTGLFFSLKNISADPKNKDCPVYIAASPSAALELHIDDLDEAIFSNPVSSPHNVSSYDGRRVLFIEGFLLDRKTLVKRILNLAEKYGLALAIDPGTAEIAAKQAKIINKILHKRKISFMLFFNEAEAEAFAKTWKTGWKELFIRLSEKKSVVAVVKLAEKGAEIFYRAASCRIKTEPVETAEYTGAGDAFAAGFLAAWLGGSLPEQCGQAGNSAAASVLKTYGSSGVSCFF